MTNEKRRQLPLTTAEGRTTTAWSGAAGPMGRRADRI